MRYVKYDRLYVSTVVIAWVFVLFGMMLLVGCYINFSHTISPRSSAVTSVTPETDKTIGEIFPEEFREIAWCVEAGRSDCWPEDNSFVAGRKKE